MWHCEQCSQNFERIDIAWGTCSGKKVDVIDIFCPSCGNSGYQGDPQLVFLGTEEEKSSYWDKEWDNGFNK